MKFHQKGYYRKDFNKNGFIEILPNSQNLVNFKRFLLQFDQDAIQDFDIKNLFDVDIEYILNSQDKINELCSASATLTEKYKQSSNEEKETDKLLLDYLADKKVENRQTEINIAIAINNLEKIKGLMFSENGVKLYFEDK